METPEQCVESLQINNENTGLTPGISINTGWAAVFTHFTQCPVTTVKTYSTQKFSLEVFCKKGVQKIFQNSGHGVLT